MIQSRSALNAKQYGFLEWWVIASGFFKAIIHLVWICSRWANKSVMEIKQMAEIPQKPKDWLRSNSKAETNEF